MTVRCDFVVPVYNALRSTRECLRSLARFAPPWARVIVVNDGSDARTTAWLREQPGILLLENPVNLGFVKTANRGLLFSDAPYVCLLNSDTLLTEGAVERIVARMDADRSLALCCPISNGAVNLSVKIPPGSDVFSFARRVARTSPALYPDACTIVGFCLFFRREVIRALGVFDEVFDRGYCEETDYHYRCRAAGWRCVVADDTWVYHRHEGSFTDRDARFARNLEILMARWRRRHEAEIAEFDRKNALGAVRDAAYEWRLPDDAPEPAEVLFLLSSARAPEASAIFQLANALLMRGTTAQVAVLDESGPPEVETFLRPLVVPPARLAELPRARLLVAAGPAAEAAVRLAGGGRPALFLDPRTLPLSGEADLFYPRGARRGVAVREPLGSGLPETSFASLSWEKRAALFGSSEIAVDLSDASALTALEAMCAGAVPVVASGSAGEARVRDGETGLVVAPGAAREALRALAADAPRLERMRAAAMAEARPRTWDAAAAAFLALAREARPLPEPDAGERASLERVVAARTIPPPPPAPPRPAFGGALRARLGRLRRRLLA